MTPWTPTLVIEGPMPRIMTRLDSLPVMMKPPIMTPSPTSTRTRVEILTGWAAGIGLGLGDGLIPGLGDGLIPGLGDGLIPGLGDGPVPGTSTVAVAFPGESWIWYVPGTQNVNEYDWPG